MWTALGLTALVGVLLADDALPGLPPWAQYGAAVILLYLIVGPERTRLFAPWWVVTDLRTRMTKLEDAVALRDERIERLRDSMDSTASDLLAKYAKLAEDHVALLKELE